MAEKPQPDPDTCTCLCTQFGTRKVSSRLLFTHRTSLMIVAIRIIPADFREKEIGVHAPVQKAGLQAVGDRPLPLGEFSTTNLPDEFLIWYFWNMDLWTGPSRNRAASQFSHLMAKLQPSELPPRKSTSTAHLMTLNIHIPVIPGDRISSPGHE
ncbi:hypothetical protein SODALDRAFT_357627 [Sodiomyces alkalinus F11]|uniref:Uncharacterized protein n=1 Tax=Sodiomyces alkalinus (strain CBS 110278 / VKM F-3762 / F11) TaxID=1314773 RepID=A0A3N2Q466_SODAK|nr:hypothetical protein SODALDRAFT_357627 [Sodiomyces alkalinus F11]ROT41571.1 hypothetical protein SODALDRAFT_357627 [Sodiomyces alkalinus F11]